MKKKKAWFFTGIILSSLILAGCFGGGDDTAASCDEALFGEWAEEIFDTGYIFCEDGTGEDTFWQIYFTYTADDGVLTITYDSDTYGSSSYEYYIENDTLFLTRISDSEDEETSTFSYSKIY